MKFDYFTGFSLHDKSETIEEAYANGMEQVQFCDQAGFEIVWFPEHHLTANTPSPAPLVSVVDAAHRTQNVRLGTGIMITPYHHPLILAGQINLVDLLTNGRLEVGFGRGGFKYEYARLGLSEAEASARQREGLEIILNGWFREDFTHEGQFFSFDHSTVIPRPYQKPAPPTWLAGRTPDTMRFAAQHGMGIMMTAQRQPIDRLRGQVNLLNAICEDLGVPRPPMTASREVFITESKKDAYRAAELIWNNHKVQWHLHQDSADTVGGFTESAPLPDSHYISPEEIIQRCVIGDVETCIERLNEYKELGYDHFTVGVNFGLPHKEVMASLEKFADQVMPHFADDSPAPKPIPSVEPIGRTSPPTPVLVDVEGLNDGWVHWEGEDWLAQFKAEQANGGARKSRIFDFASAPKVRAHADGSIDNDGYLKLVSDMGCPECGRPVIALCFRQDGESDASIKEALRERMKALDWHQRHTNR